MDILELIDDKDQSIAESSLRPFQCPEPDCVKVSSISDDNSSNYSFIII